MVGSFASLGISLSGMNAAQAGLNITGQNISNANTEGYTRKLVNLTALDYGELPGIKSPLTALGGVGIEKIYRAREEFLDAQFRRQNSDYKYAEVVEKFTIAMNDILGEPSDVGLTEKLNSFYAAASDLAANPHLETAKTVFVNSAKALTETFNHIDASISELRYSIDNLPSGEIDSQINELNQKLDLLAKTHQRIIQEEAVGHDSTSLQDTRDLLLDEISAYMDINIETYKNGDFKRLTISSNPTEAKSISSLNFGNHDAAIAAIGPGANVLELSFNNGNGVAVGPITVNLDDDSSIRDVVDKINRTFKAAGGKGTVASLDINNRLVLDTSLIDDSKDSLSAEVSIGAGSDAAALAALGLVVGTTNGSETEKYTVVDDQGVHYKFGMEQGNNEIGHNAAKLTLLENTVLENKVGYIDKFTGSLGGLYQAANIEIPEMRDELSKLAMNIKTAVNDVLKLGTTTSGLAGSPLFIGHSAADFDIDAAIASNISLLAQGKTGAVSDGDIAQEIAELFFNESTIVSDKSQNEKIYIDSNSVGTTTSTIPLIPGQQIDIAVEGIINQLGTIPMNAGDNGLGAGSLIQIEFLDSTGAMIGAAIDFPASSGPPEDKVTYSGIIPAGAANLQFKVNAAYADPNNLGHFGIKIHQGEDTQESNNFNKAISDLVGDYGTRGSLARAKLDSAEALNRSIENNRMSISGVSLEEEAANLIMYQNSFAANARVMSVIDQVLQEILNIL
jgi:flagellar hook-associated protein FlgK